MALAERLKEVMDENKITPAMLGKRIGGKPRATVHGWLSGRIKEISSELLPLVEQALGVNGTWLNTGKGNKYRWQGMLGKVKRLSQSDVEEYWLKMIILCNDLIYEGLYPDCENSRRELYYKCVDIMAAGNYPPLKNIEDILRSAAAAKENK